jgi:uncharacterized protein (TIGR00725 family)
MGSAAPESTRLETGSKLVEKAEQLARVLAAKEVVLLTGATTGIVYVVGKTAHEAGSFHIGISPGSSEREHVKLYKLPLDACDALVYTGFGLKGRNVVLVRSCDVVLFVAGAMGSLNEFTIAHDEGKIIGCLTGTGGVADESEYLLQKFGKRTVARVFHNEDPEQLVEDCLNSLDK